MKFSAVIEIPKNSLNKNEINKETGELVIDRILSIPCPQNYGYIPNTLSGDGDPLDIFIVSPDPIKPLTEVKFRPWGILLCEDNGLEDNKVIAGVDGSDYIDFDYFNSIKHYLENYKTGFKILEYKIFNDNILFTNFVEGKNV